MNTEQERADFEAWMREEYPDYPLEFSYGVYYYSPQQRMFEAFKAGRAALQSQVNNEAAGRVREFLDKWVQIRLNDKAVIYRLNDLELRVDDLRALIALQSQDRVDAELVEILREAAEIIAAVPTDYAPENLRGPIVDELEGFALMLDRARRIEGTDHE